MKLFIVLYMTSHTFFELDIPCVDLVEFTFTTKFISTELAFSPSICCTESHASDIILLEYCEEALIVRTKGQSQELSLI